MLGFYYTRVGESEWGLNYFFCITVGFLYQDLFDVDGGNKQMWMQSTDTNKSCKQQPGVKVITDANIWNQDPTVRLKRWRFNFFVIHAVVYSKELLNF